MINCRLYVCHKHHRYNNILIVNIITAKKTCTDLQVSHFLSTVLKVPTHTCTSIIIINNELPDISLRIGRSKVGISDRQALQVRRLRCLGRRLTINSYQMYLFQFINCISFSASIVFLLVHQLYFFFIACFHFKVLCVKFDLI